MVKIIIKLWQLPQIILGWLLIKRTKAQHEMDYKNIQVYTWERVGAISLGAYIIVPTRNSIKLIKHEYGHTRQSLYFGWFYLIIIGVPSFIQAWMRGRGYNVRTFPEQWADRLGGISG